MRLQYRMRSRAVGLLAGALAALGTTHGSTPVAGAGAEWCECDPLVVVATPGGALVPVFVTNAGLGLLHLAAVQLAQLTYTVTPVPNGQQTQVNLRVLIPNDLFGEFPTRSTASSGPLRTGTIYATAQGHCGQPLHLTFTLNVP
ncbi:MAG TPA: hypothetical protein VHS99_05255 [Chloroflexota bacterium]|jgi:hypothetical protein|nr:hypothetical protein [Chloroflexota bacterium]